MENTDQKTNETGYKDLPWQQDNKNKNAERQEPLSLDEIREVIREIRY